MQFDTLPFVNTTIIVPYTAESIAPSGPSLEESAGRDPKAAITSSSVMPIVMGCVDGEGGIDDAGEIDEDASTDALGEDAEQLTSRARAPSTVSPSRI